MYSSVQMCIKQHPSPRTEMCGCGGNEEQCEDIDRVKYCVSDDEGSPVQRNRIFIARQHINADAPLCLSVRFQYCSETG